MVHFKELEEELAKYLSEAQLAEVKRAYVLASRAHRGQKRRTGEPYITHPVSVALILAKMRLDYQTIIATLLHDVLEDTPVNKDELTEAFGEDIAELVDGVSKLTQINFGSRAEMQAENFRKMVLAMVRDIRVIIVKLADRLHNMRTIDYVPHEKQCIKARETLEIYAPIANRLGMHQFFIELEDLGFRALHPLRYHILQKALQRAIGNRKEIMKKIQTDLQKSLETRHIEVSHIISRQKHIYSIYKKMRIKHMSFAEIMDVYGFRFIVRNEDDAYRVLGAVHHVYKPVPERFKDYIAIPKSNGYQSLHTTLFGPFGVPIEIQIRTEEMNKVADNGIAAHWMYKSVGSRLDHAQIRGQAWVRSLMEMQESSGSSLEFIESVKIDLFPDEVYVFTPKGDIMELPRGATPVDFAYAVHSDVGNSCVAAKLNKRLAPLSQSLMNGQTVEIITAPGACPNPAWLDFVVTAKAKSNIRHFLKTQERAQSISLGKRLLAQSLKVMGRSLHDLSPGIINAVLHQYHCHNFEELVEKIGQGNLVAPVVARHFAQDQHVTSDPALLHEKPLLHIKGTEGLVVKYSECCRPIPGDPIVGFLEAGQGIWVHVESCPAVATIRQSNPERLLIMRWEQNISGEFLVDLVVEVANERGVLAGIATTIAAADANIHNISVDPQDGLYNKVSMTLNVRDRQHLASIMRRLRGLLPVIRITRTRKGV